MRKPNGFTVPAVTAIAEKSGFLIEDTATIPARAARYAPIPAALHPALRAALDAKYGSGLYEHQSGALEAVLGGRDVCLSTATASGKSLMFIAFACHVLLKEPSSRVLALYPSRALIQDQITKWQEWAEQFGHSVAYLDGGVPVAFRLDILRRSRVVLMTPDVAQAWLLGSVAERDVRTFRSQLRLLVLDEAHVYDGVFGTNMAYLLRRLEVASGSYQIICSTATLGEPDDFVEKLTGRQPRTFTAADDGSAVPPKTVILASGAGPKTFDGLARLLV
jgi:DEAD/DEAH box helicase domain-containing protein